MNRGVMADDTPAILERVARSAAGRVRLVRQATRETLPPSRAPRRSPATEADRRARASAPKTSTPLRRLCLGGPSCGTLAAK